jgi:hypothetical protein
VEWGDRLRGGQKNIRKLINSISFMAKYLTFDFFDTNFNYSSYLKIQNYLYFNYNVVYYKYIFDLK